MATRDEEIRGLRELQAKQNQIKSLQNKISSLKSQVAALREQRKETFSLNLLPTNNALTLENTFNTKNSRRRKTCRIVTKILLILLILALFASVSLLFYENSDFLYRNEPLLKDVVDKYQASNPEKLQASPIYNLLLLSGLYTLAMLLATFIPWDYLFVSGILGVAVVLFALIMMICCCAFLGRVDTTYSCIPAVALLFSIIYQVLPWRTDEPLLSRSQLRQLEKARTQDEQNYEQNQRTRTEFSRGLAKDQRSQIMALNDQINDCEDQIDALEEALADNDLLVGNQLIHLPSVLHKLETGLAANISQALYADADKVFTFDEAESKRLDQEMRRRADRFNHQLDMQQAADLAADAQRQADEHNRKIDSLHKEQKDLLKRITDHLK